MFPISLLVQSLIQLPHALQHFASVCVQRLRCLIQHSMKMVPLFVKERANFILVEPQGQPESHTWFLMIKF